MNAQTLATQDHGEMAGGTIKKIVEGCEMKAANAITTLNNWVHRTPGKLLGALAVGGLIMTAAIVTPSSAFADEPSRPLGIEASQGYGPIDDMAINAALLDAKRSFWGYGSIDDMAQAALLNTKLDTRLHTNGMDFVEDNPARVTKQDTRLYTNGIDFVEDNPARVTKQDTRLYTNGIDFVEETGVGRTSNRVEASQGIGTIFDLAMDALLATDPSRASKQDTRLYTNGIDFVEDSPARISKLEWGLYPGIDFVVDSPARTSKLEWGLYPGIDFVVDSPARTSKLDTRLHTNGIDFVEDTNVGKVAYSESVGFGPLSDMIAAAELSSARGGDYIFWADFPN